MKIHHRHRFLRSLSLLIVAIALMSCGNDDNEVISADPFVTQTGFVVNVAGIYDVTFTPIASNCTQILAVGSQQELVVSQFGGSIIMDFNGNATSSGGVYVGNGIFIEIGPFQGPISVGATFDLSSTGAYFDEFTGKQGPVDQFITGTFSPTFVDGISDTYLYDPFFGTTCTLRHSFFGAR